MSDEKVLHVGIDLGTSRSSIAGSNGERHVVRSYVGWPVDMVARKVLKKQVLVGDEAVDNRSMLDLHRPLEEGLIKEGASKDEEAVTELLRHLLELGEATKEAAGKKKVRAVVGVPAKALRVNKQSLRQTIGPMVDSLMVVSEPFAVAYSLDALLHSMVIDIGAGTADFCVMRGRIPGEEDQRTLTTAGDWLDQQLTTQIRQAYPDADFTIHMVQGWKEKYSFVGEAPEPVLVKAPVDGRPTELDITEPMRKACESILPPTIETMLDLLSRVDPDYQEQVRNNVVLSGGTALIRGLGTRLQKELGEIGGGRVRVVKDPVYVGADGGLAIAQDASDSEWQQLGG
jgi:rod shape-determining protein MreB